MPVSGSSTDAFFNAKMETLPPAELLSLRSTRFTETVRNAFDKSQFYRRAFSTMGLSREDVKSLEDLQKLKFFTTKDDLRSVYPFGMLTVPIEEVVEVHASSGTTGTPVLGLHTERDLDDWAEMSARSLFMSGMRKDDIFQITPSFGMFTGGFGFYHGARKIGATIVPAGAGFSKRQIQFMQDFGTTMFSSIVSYAFRLAETAHEMGVDLKTKTKVRKGVFGSEVWTKEAKRKLGQLWDLEPYDIYGFTELYGPGVGNDCSVHDGLHMWEDFFLVEVVDPKTGEPLGPEEEGELVFTTLSKEAMPLIRFRSRDVSFLMDSRSCDCGRTHRRYKEIIARTDEMVKVSGVNFWPSQVEQILLKKDGFGQEYRIHISRVDFVDRMRIEVESASKLEDPALKEKLAAELASDLHNVLTFSPEVAIVDPGSLPRAEVGKAQRMADERRNA